MSGEHHSRRAAEAVRSSMAYIDVRGSDGVDEWLEDVVQPVIDTLRELGWTVTRPREDGA